MVVAGGEGETLTEAGDGDAQVSPDWRCSTLTLSALDLTM